MVDWLWLGCVLLLCFVLCDWGWFEKGILRIFVVDAASELEDHGGKKSKRSIWSWHGDDYKFTKFIH